MSTTICNSLQIFCHESHIFHLFGFILRISTHILGGLYLFLRQYACCYTVCYVSMCLISLQYQKWKLAQILFESLILYAHNNGTVILEILYQKQSNKNIFFENRSRAAARAPTL